MLASDSRYLDPGQTQNKVGLKTRWDVILRDGEWLQVSHTGQAKAFVGGLVAPPSIGYRVLTAHTIPG
jgi:hypothetical protein